MLGGPLRAVLSLLHGCHRVHSTEHYNREVIEGPNCKSSLALTGRKVVLFGVWRGYK